MPLRRTFLLFFPLLSFFTTRSQDISAHRGHDGYAPENTLAAFRNTLLLKVQYIEIDVRTTLDKIPVVLHDARLERTTNGKGAVKLHPSSYLKTLSAGKGYPPIFEKEKIPTLEETCQLISIWNLTQPHKTFIYLDAKEVAPKPLLSILKKYRLEKNSVFYGSDDFLLKLKKEFPEARILPALKDPRDIIKRYRALKPYAFDVSPDILSKKLVEELHSLGVKVFVDLLGPRDTAGNYLIAREMGVDLIQTDRILAVQKVLETRIW
jgi:glycerophosphoryl diester phosphodiesterase